MKPLILLLSCLFLLGLANCSTKEPAEKAEPHLARWADANLWDVVPLKQSTGAPGKTTSLALPNGKFLVGSTNKVVRVKENYFLDMGFGDDGVFSVPTDDVGNGSADYSSFAIQPDGKFLVAGVGTVRDSTGAFVSAHLMIRRYSSEAKIDTSFGQQGVYYQNVTPPFRVTGIAVQPDGRILVAHERIGSNSKMKIALIRIKPDGTGPDITFLQSQHGFSTIDVASNGLALRSDGRILLLGTSQSNELFIVQINSDGSTDASYAGDGYISGQELGLDAGTYQIRNIFGKPDGTLYAVASINQGNSTGYRVMKISPNAIADESFAPNGYLDVFSEGGSVQADALDVLSDGTLIVGGSLLTNLVPTGVFIEKISSAGELHTGSRYTAETPAEKPEVRSFCPLEDGKFLGFGTGQTTDGTPAIIYRYF